MELKDQISNLETVLNMCNVRTRTHIFKRWRKTNTILKDIANIWWGLNDHAKELITNDILGIVGDKP